MGEPVAEEIARGWAVRENDTVGWNSATAAPGVAGIDLANSFSLNGVSIPENLPQFQDGWMVEKWHECVDTFPSEYSSQGAPQEGVDRSNSGQLKEEDRWNFVMNKLISIEKNTCNLTKDFNTLSSKVEAQEGLIKGVKSATTSNEKQINELYKKQESIAAEFDQRVEAKLRLEEDSRQRENAAFQAQIMQKVDERVRDAAQEMRDDFIQEQCESRKLNLIFVGIKETEGEVPLSVITSFLKNRMQITGARVDSAYRLGKVGGNNPRPILARFPYPARQRIWFSKSKIKSNKEEGKVWIHEDLPKAAKYIHRICYRILKKAKSLGDRYEGAHIKGQCLFVNVEAYRLENLESLPEELRPSSLATLQSESAVAFFGRFSPLSNHHPSPFQVHDKFFTCMEQFLAWSRATLAEDQALISKTLTEADPVVYKRILNDLHNSKPDEWKEQLNDTALVGLRAKFHQNPALAHFLCSTNPKILGEASLNKTWGTGFTLTHPDVLTAEKWPDKGNLLGKSLMIIREEMLVNKNA